MTTTKTFRSCYLFCHSTPVLKRYLHRAASYYIYLSVFMPEYFIYGISSCSNPQPQQRIRRQMNRLLSHSVSESQTNQQSVSTDATGHEDIGASTVQKDTSYLKSTRHLPLTPVFSHRHSSVDSRRSISPVQSVESGQKNLKNLTPASNASFRSHCGLTRIRNAFHPNEHTSKLGPEPLGQSSRLLFEDDKSLD